MQRHHGEHTLNPTGTAQQVAGHGFGGADHGLVSGITQGGFDGVGFVLVAQRGGRAVGVQIMDLVGIHPGIAHGIEHGTARAVHVGGRHVPGIGAHAVTA